LSGMDQRVVGLIGAYDRGRRRRQRTRPALLELPRLARRPVPGAARTPGHPGKWGRSARCHGPLSAASSASRSSTWYLTSISRTLSPCSPG
jgi:hypothetical protein